MLNLVIVLQSSLSRPPDARLNVELNSVVTITFSVTLTLGERILLTITHKVHERHLVKIAICYFVK